MPSALYHLLYNIRSLLVCEQKYLLSVVGDQYKDTGNGQATAYGAAYTFQDSSGVQRVFFAANLGTVGIWELIASSVDLDARIVSIRSLGVPSADTRQNDGMCCKSPL